MKTFILVIALLAGSAHAGMSCTTDVYGSTTCYGTDMYSGPGKDTGTLFGSTDVYGGSTWMPNDGPSFYCSTDLYGNTTCN